MKKLSNIIHNWKYAEFHGITEHHLGVAQIYYMIPYFNKAKWCVCIGSGTGIVPLIIREGQKDSGVNDSTTILIDAINGVNGSAHITNQIFNDPNSEFNQLCDVKFMQKTSAEAINDIDFEIDYLHIDGDHSYAGASLDWELYSPKVRINGYVTIHDTDIDYLEQFDWFHAENKWYGGPARLVDELKTNEAWEQFSIHDKRSTGVTILKRIK